MPVSARRSSALISGTADAVRKSARIPVRFALNGQVVVNKFTPGIGRERKRVLPDEGETLYGNVSFSSVFVPLRSPHTQSRAAVFPHPTPYSLLNFYRFFLVPQKFFTARGIFAFDRTANTYRVVPSFSSLPEVLIISLSNSLYFDGCRIELIKMLRFDL